jgi:glutamyl/glutaminyl-tRNA synthetase
MLPAGGWRASAEPVRVQLPDEPIALIDESGLDLAQAPAQAMGDPVVRRRDGVVAYQLAVVVDDAASGVTRVVRGRDIAPSTATQVALQRLLGLATPAYRHHLLLLEPRGDKLAKLHGSVGAAALRPHYSAAALCGLLACAAGLRAAPEPCTPRELLPGFSWATVRDADRVVTWTGAALVTGP